MKDKLSGVYEVLIDLVSSPATKLNPSLVRAFTIERESDMALDVAFAVSSAMLEGRHRDVISGFLVLLEAEMVRWMRKARPLSPRRASMLRKRLCTTVTLLALTNNWTVCRLFHDVHLPHIQLF